MREYEVTCIFKVEEGGVEQGRNAVKVHLEKSGVVVLKEDDMGNRALAYPIKKQDRGHYFCYTSQIDPVKIPELDRDFRLDESVLKFLIVKK